MGAGCHYTLTDNRNIRAYWVSLSDYDNEDGEDEEEISASRAEEYTMLVEDLVSLVQELPLGQTSRSTFDRNSRKNPEVAYGQFFKMEFSPTYYGDGIILDLQFAGDSEDNPLARNIHQQVYEKIARAINKQYELCIATSGYTSHTYETGALQREFDALSLKAA